MAKNSELAVFGEFFHGRVFPRHGVPFQVRLHFRRQDKETAIDPTAVTTRFFQETLDLIAFQLQRAKPSRRLYCGDCREKARLFVLLDRSRDVDVADAVAVGQAKKSVLVDIR